MRIIADCHTHTSYSDGAASVEAMVSAAERAGLACIVISDHLTLPHAMDPGCEVSVREDDLDALTADIRRARDAHPGIEVIHGFECDYYTGCEANIARWAKDATFRLGSVHGIDGDWIDDLSNPGYWSGHSVEEVWRAYFDTWCAACACGFHTMAHPDLVKLRGLFPRDERLLDELYAQGVRAAALTGVHVEMNSAGLLKPVAQAYPSLALLRMFREADVPITMGSDAHTADRVGEGLDHLADLALLAGYDSYDVPTADGAWRSLPLR